MKKAYSTPEVEKINFQYRDQVVVASSTCNSKWVNEGEGSCTDGNSHLEYLK